ncbi:MAG: cytidylate kinase-like family protein [Oscillospiraceae bacterium]|nr:cytidylate kinase-like family protein [Oscillospiraceae bacterium]
MKNIITISREYGSGGYEIGQKAADVLGFQFYDKELIAQIAENLLVSESFMRYTEDKPIRRNIFRETFPMLSSRENEDADFIFAQQGKFIVELAEKGKCVIAGRRADYYLRDNPKAFHLFFYADTDFKVDRICRKENCTAEEALKKITDMDKRRKTSYEYVTGRKWGDRHNYDRMICTSSFGIEKCVDEIVLLMLDGNKS